MGSILVARIENAVIIHVESSLVSCDVDLLVYLLLLAGDEAEDVAAGAIEVHLCLLSITNHVSSCFLHSNLRFYMITISRVSSRYPSHGFGLVLILIPKQVMQMDRSLWVMRRLRLGKPNR